MRQLTEALLPSELRRQLLECAESGAGITVRVAPSPPAAAVPWGLFFVDERTRLLEIAEVSWIAPVLLRDVRDAPGPLSWRDTRDRPPLHVMDPLLSEDGQVLLDPMDAIAITGDQRTQAQHEVTSAALSAALHRPVSRFYFLGHCSANTHPSEPRAHDMGLVLSDLRGGAPEPLTAATLIANPTTWPMPPRAAVVACASGADMADFEPFGLATALLNNGAALVQATLWPLPTDHALSLHAHSTGRPFRSLAHAIEVAQSSDAPIAGLHAWQRERLATWRRCPSIDTSPLLWGSAMTMTAPLRRLGPSSDHAAFGTAAQDRGGPVDVVQPGHREQTLPARPVRTPGCRDDARGP